MPALRRQCPHCDRTFNRTEHVERHIRTHTRELPFLCHECGKSYSRRDTLLRHQRKHSVQTSTRPDDNIGLSSAPSCHSAEVRGRDTLSNTSSSPVKIASAYSPNHPPLPVTSDGLQGTSSTQDHAEYNPNPKSVLPEDNVVMASFEPVIETQMPASVGMAFDLDWGQDFRSWLMESTADVYDVFFPLANDIDQPACSEAVAFHEQGVPVNSASPELESLWFTHVRAGEESRLLSGVATPSEPREEVDENYRQTMRSSLQIRSLDTTLPSSGFINLCIRLYFTRFHPKFPVIHVPTFQPSKTNSMLLLSICSIGSLITGTADGLAQGAHIWEILNKAVLAKWERLVTELTDDLFAVLQAALLGQTFALLSGDPKHVAAAEAFHGTLISLARRSKTCQVSHKDLPRPDSFKKAVDIEWRAWAREEELIRMSLGLYLHDAELAHIFHHEPLLRASRRVSCAASDEIFAAGYPKEWLSQLHQRIAAEDVVFAETCMDQSGSKIEARRMERFSHFTKYVQLQGISATILEDRLSGRLNGSAQRLLANDLVEFRESYLRHLPTKDTSSLEMDTLYHLSFISLCTDFDLLERVIGRDGPQVTAMDLENVKAWAASLDAKRAIVHMRLVRQKLEALPIGLVPAVHIPRAIFFVAVSCYCVFSYSSSVDESSSSSMLDYPELENLDLDPGTQPFGKLTALETKELLCSLLNILQHLGHWEIARRFAAIVETLLRQTLF